MGACRSVVEVGGSREGVVNEDPFLRCHELDWELFWFVRDACLLG